MAIPSRIALSNRLCRKSVSRFKILTRTLQDCKQKRLNINKSECNWWLHWLQVLLAKAWVFFDVSSNVDNHFLELQTGRASTVRICSTTKVPEPGLWLVSARSWRWGECDTNACGNQIQFGTAKFTASQILNWHSDNGLKSIPSIQHNCIQLNYMHAQSTQNLRTHPMTKSCMVSSRPSDDKFSGLLKDKWVMSSKHEPNTLLCGICWPARGGRPDSHCSSIQPATPCNLTVPMWVSTEH